MQILYIVSLTLNMNVEGLLTISVSLVWSPLMNQIQLQGFFHPDKMILGDFLLFSALTWKQ